LVLTELQSTHSSSLSRWERWIWFRKIFLHFDFRTYFNGYRFV
jgi:hypothetical protein